jgi:hypothetical protein
MDKKVKKCSRKKPKKKIYIRLDNKRKDRLVPKRQREALLYAIWCSIPMVVKSASLKDLSKWGYDINDQQFLEMRSIKTKKDIAKYLSVSVETITDWVKSDWVQDMINEINKANIARFIPDVDHAFVMKTIEEADASRVKLFKQLNQGWVEKNETSMPELKSALKGIQDNVIKLITQEKNK